MICGYIYFYFWTYLSCLISTKFIYLCRCAVIIPRSIFKITVNTGRTGWHFCENIQSHLDNRTKRLPYYEMGTCWLRLAVSYWCMKEVSYFQCHTGVGVISQKPHQGPAGYPKWYRHGFSICGLQVRVSELFYW